VSIKSIKIKNLLSFDELVIKDFKDINCIVGKNNSGKSNLLKLIRFFYDKLDRKRVLPPTLNSNYSSFGTITIIYDTSRIKKIVTSGTNKDKSSFFKHIYNILFKKDTKNNILSILYDNKEDSTYELTLKINSDDSIQWSTKSKEVLNIINYLYPFFEIETRHIDLYDWNKLWIIVSRLKSFKIDNLKQDEIIEFFNNKLNGYQKYVKTIENITQTGKYHYRERVLNYVKAGLKGQTFLINEQSLEMQSDGTNSHRFIEIALELLISLTRREYINPTIYIDEPEVGLHPKRNEELIYKLYDTYTFFKKTKEETKEKGKYKTPYPKVIFATHSPNIVKEVIKLFENNQQILHFSKKDKDNTKVQKMNSTYKDKRFLNIFSDNEARLFFSNFILFVEGATEMEIFSNQKLINAFKNKKGDKFLNFIDIYQINDVALKYINPSYSNTSIPYLIIYDADKLINIDFTKQKLNFKKDVLNLYNFLKLYSKSYFGSKKYLIYEFLKQLLAWEKKILLQFDSKKLFMVNINYKLLISYINSEFAIFKNYRINNTTIEEVLINEKSFSLFRKWLFLEFKNSIKTSYNDKTPESKILTIKKNKIKEYVSFRRFIKNNFNYKERVILFILLFGGKSETSVATFTSNYNSIDEQFRKNLKKVKKNWFENKKSLNLSYLMGKTSGWTTSFLNFAIDEIEKSITETDEKKREKDFRDKFKQNFRELYDIIIYIETKI